MNEVVVPPTLEFRVLGPLEVVRESRSVGLGGRKQRTLLAVLLLHANEVLSIDFLVDALWGEQPPATAAKTIQVYISRFRKTLGERTLVTRPPGYALLLEPAQLDSLRAERFLHQARGAAPEEAARILREALGLWRGTGLADLEYESFAQAEVIRLKELRLACLEARIDADLAVSRHADVVGELEKLVAEHPVRERFRWQLMLALYRCGRQSDALAVYRSGRKQLIEELGLAPTPDLQNLEGAILRQDPALDLPPTSQAVDRDFGPATAEPVSVDGFRTGLAAEVTCPGCGRDVRKEARFCEACGTAIQGMPAPAREQRKTVTVLFCDVTDSTALGERLDPESLRQVMARYFKLTKEIVEHHGGTVEKFIGDAVMAVFGVPVVHEDDALRAVRAAAELRDGLARLNEDLERDFGTVLSARIGVNTGEVVLGTTERLATGDAVNVAARLEQAAEPGQILIGHETFPLVRAAVEVDRIDQLELKGKAQPVSAYRLLAVHPGATGFSRDLERPLIGRARELGRLQDAFAQASGDRSCQLFTILGSAGVGKSRLVYEFTAGLTDATVVRGRCLAYGETITYWPVVEVLKQLLGVDPTGRLQQLAPEPAVAQAILSVLGENSFAASTGEIAWAFRELLEAQARWQPLVVVFEDIHWADATLLDLIEHVTDLARDAPLLVLCEARAELLEERPSWGGGKLNATAMLLEPLSEDDTNALIDSLLVNGPDEHLKGRIRNAAEGNPLFIEQMVALVSESGGKDVAAPPTIQALLAARLDRLDLPARRVLESASIEGRIFHRGAIEALLPEELAVPEHLISLVRQELVRRDRSQLPGDDGFRFRHQLIREAAYDALPKSTRAELHERLADWLETHAGNLVELDEIVGYHLDQAFTYQSQLGPVDNAGRALAARAAAHLGAAGRAALERMDSAAARALLQRACDLLPREAPERVALLPDLSYALSVVDTQAAIETATEGIELARFVGDEHAEWQARLALLARKVDTNADRRTLAEFGAEIDAELDQLTIVGDELLLARAWNLRAWVADGSTRDAAARQAMEHAHRGGARRQWEAAANTLALDALFGPTPTAEAMTFCEEVRDAPDVSVHTTAMFDIHRALLLAFAGRIDDGRELYFDSRSRIADLGDLRNFHTCAFWRFWIEWCAEDVAASEGDLLACWEALEKSGDAIYNSTTAATLAQVSVDRGRDDEAFCWCERAEEITSADDWETVPLARAARGIVLARRGDVDAGTRLAEEAVALSRAHFDYVTVRAIVLLRLAEVHRLANRPDGEHRALEEALAVCEAKGVAPVAERIRAQL